MNQRSVAFVSPYSHHGAISGAQKRVENLCAALSARGVAVTCLSPWKPRSGAKHVFFSLDGNMREKLTALSGLGRTLRKLSPSTVISESPLPPLPPGPWRLLHMIHDAKFATVHARRGAKLARVAHWISARVAHAVVTVSHAESKRVQRVLGLPSDKIIVSYNGIEQDWLLPIGPAAYSPHFDLLYVANFARHKGHMALLRALRGTGLSVAFVGADFGLKGMCIAAASEWQIKAQFFEGLSESRLIELYDACRVFVFPSELEGFGMPYLEARARGLPVLANDLPIFHELRSRVGGAITNFANAEQVRSQLQTLLAMPKVQADLSEFTWNSIAEKLLDEVPSQ